MTSVGAFISANVDVVIVVEAFAIRVLGALCLALIHGPTVKGLFPNMAVSLADAEISTEFLRNAVRTANLLPLAIVRFLVRLKRCFAPTPVAVTTVECFQCGACQLVCVRPKFAAVSKATIFLCTCILTISTITARAITALSFFQIAARGAILLCDKIVAAVTMAIRGVKTSFSTAGDHAEAEHEKKQHGKAT